MVISLRTGDRTVLSLRYATVRAEVERLFAEAKTTVGISNDLLFEAAVRSLRARDCLPQPTRPSGLMRNEVWRSIHDNEGAERAEARSFFILGLRHDADAPDLSRACDRRRCVLRHWVVCDLAGRIPKALTAGAVCARVCNPCQQGRKPEQISTYRRGQSRVKAKPAYHSGPSHASFPCDAMSRGLVDVVAWNTSDTV